MLYQPWYSVLSWKKMFNFNFSDLYDKIKSGQKLLMVRYHMYLSGWLWVIIFKKRVWRDFIRRQWNSNAWNWKLVYYYSIFLNSNPFKTILIHWITELIQLPLKNVTIPSMEIFLTNKKFCCIQSSIQKNQFHSN
jgi:hypothetical protein